MTSVALRLEPTEQVIDAEVELSWGGHRTEPVNANFADLLLGTSPPDAAVDLLLLACAVYAADKAVPRDVTRDRWTRDLEIDVPQIDPDRLPVGQTEELLTFLTGDRWRVLTHGTAIGRARLGAANQAALREPSRIALFSGGLDSFAHLVSAPPEPSLFIAHRDSSALSPLQKTLFEAGRPSGADWELRQFTYTISRRGGLAGVSELEASTRSRSLLFYAAAVAVAAGVGAETVTVPENGFISLNPPLVTARRGTLSTRTTHPWTVHLTNRLVASLGLGVALENPFSQLTKGEVTATALENSSAARVFATISCSRPRARRASALHFGNCGYCYPCLVRRSGILSLGVRDRTPYRADPRTTSSFLWSPTGDDFRSVLARAREPFRLSDLTVSGPIPPALDPIALLDLIERARGELWGMLDAGLSKDMRNRLNW